MTSELKTPDEVVTALGGIQAVADLTGRSYSTTAQYSRFGKFPSHTFLIMTKALAARGKTASPALWSMTVTKKRAAT